ncbi:hypothetical protein [Allobaculum sp. Allo2]|uniref:hypothetical protein n=1 Tax=Allobaculum sp. Allo2 TaxID=2853432 RepID=UPI001F6034A8|nr:hypothetical protein [Allobaculum sp. Allo2]UNT93476.1 hypothetical protein KWG61_01260 [Allobaculum sp. Allo2]
MRFLFRQTAFSQILWFLFKRKGPAKGFFFPFVAFLTGVPSSIAVANFYSFLFQIHTISRGFAQRCTGFPAIEAALSFLDFVSLLYPAVRTRFWQGVKKQPFRMGKSCRIA